MATIRFDSPQPLRPFRQEICIHAASPVIADAHQPSRRHRRFNSTRYPTRDRCCGCLSAQATMSRPFCCRADDRCRGALTNIPHRKPSLRLDLWRQPTLSPASSASLVPACRLSAADDCRHSTNVSGVISGGPDTSAVQRKSLTTKQGPACSGRHYRVSRSAGMFRAKCWHAVGRCDAGHRRPRIDAYRGHRLSVHDVARPITSDWTTAELPPRMFLPRSRGRRWQLPRNGGAYRRSPPAANSDRRRSKPPFSVVEGRRHRHRYARALQRPLRQTWSSVPELTRRRFSQHARTAARHFRRGH